MDPEALDVLNATLEYAHTEPTPSLLLSEHIATEQVLAGSRSVDTALYFSSLLLNPQYQPNCVRLEALVHLCLATEDGNGSLSPEQICKCFKDLGEGRCGIKEDPIEDLFVGNLVTADGNFRVLEGTWESGAFYLQRFLDVLATAPDKGIFPELRANTHALLTLSDRLCSRFGLERYTAGAKYPKQSLAQDDVSTDAAQDVIFSDSDLVSLGLSKPDLEPFVLTMEWRNKLAEIPVGHSPLQQLPLVETQGGIAFALPSATTYAIRMFLTRRLIECGYMRSLADGLAAVYGRLLKHTPVVEIPRNIPLQFTGSQLRIAEVMQEIDAGRFVQFLFILDDFSDVKATGISGHNESLARHATIVHEHIGRACAHAKTQPDYRKGMTLIVTCGIGRGAGLPLPDVDDNWSVQALSAPDLLTLSWTRDFNMLKFWKAFEALDQLTEAGVELINVNGIVNFIAWMKSNDWQVLPHSQVPKGFRLGGGVVQLPTNALFELRLSTTRESDRIGIHHPNKGFIPCRKENDSFFAMDDEQPIYMPEMVAPGEDIPFVYRSRERAWWCVATAVDNVASYDRWLTMKTWMPRIVKAVEQYTPDLSGAVSIAVNFCGVFEDGKPQPIPTADEIRESVTWSVSHRTDSIKVTVGTSFELGMQAPTNLSEANLVSELCSAVLEVARVRLSDSQRENLQRQVLPNEHARHLHALQVRSFRDFVGASLRETPIELDDIDSAALRIGLAFRVEPREKGRFSTRSKRQSTKLLNGIVRELEIELCDLVRQFDRQKLVEMAMVNHERAIFSRERWMRTAKANLALRCDEIGAADVITQRDIDLSSVIFPSQIIAEIAISESQLSNGLTPGQLDFTRMMNLIIVIAHFGGWSDAIHMDAMPPGLTITALGDIQVDQQFRTDILMPFSQTHSKSRVDNSVENYTENYQAPIVGSPSSNWDPRFEAAWKEEFGASLNDLRGFVDVLEDIGSKKREAVFCVQKSDVLTALNAHKLVDAERILDAFTLHPRETWRTVPIGYEEKDIQPWRFRRQLSAIRRPILQLDDSLDPNLMIAPGFIRQSTAYVIENYFEGTFPSRHYRTAAIRNWHDRRRKERGTKFAEAVATELRKHDWECLTEQEVKTLIQCGKDAEFGDVRRFGDVDVVAWNTGQRRLLLIECKHLYHGKTPGEIAEQLSDYRGEVRKDGRKKKKDDLRKHLDRLEVLHARRDAVCRTVRVDSSTRFEGWIVFKNPVPMLFAWKAFEGKVQIATFDDIPRISSTKREEA